MTSQLPPGGYSHNFGVCGGTLELFHADNNCKNIVHHLINARGVYLILGVQAGCLIDRKLLKEGGVYSHNCDKFNKTNMISAKISREVKKFTEYPPHQMIRLGRLKAISLFQIPTSMSQSSLRVIAQPRPQGFSLKKWVRLVTCPLVHPKIPGVIN